MKIAIIGAGASGCMTALSIKEINPNAIVDIYEKEDKILKKLAATGGGRCNLGNLNINSCHFNNSEYIDRFILDYPVDSYLKYFRKYNLAVCSEGDLLYPHSKKAATVIEFFKDRLKETSVNIFLNYEVKNYFSNSQISINNKFYDKLVIAIGSNALVSSDVYRLVNKYFSITNISQSLVGFKSKMIKNLKGVRQQARVSLVRNGDIIKKELGEIQFKDDGLSGICVMNLSSKYQKNDYLEIDFLLEDISIEQLKKSFSTTHLFFKYYFDAKLNDLILAGIPNLAFSVLSDNELLNFINLYKRFCIKIDGLYDYKFAQVCRGGVRLNEVDGFKSKQYRNIYFTGEILDVDAICGGYNLWFAFNSGMKVGSDCASNS